MGESVNGNTNIYLPERIFVRNLFELCNYDNQGFFNQINNLIKSEIQSRINELRNRMEKLKSNGDLSIFTPGFVKLMKKFSQISGKKNIRKASDYILLDCYNNITETLRLFKINNPSIIGKEDKIKLTAFERHINTLINEECGAVSARQLQRLLAPNGSQYEKKQKNIINYIIHNVIPALLMQGKQINQMCKKWNQILFYYGHPLQKRIFIQEDETEKIESYFNEKFMQISNLETDNYEEIGDALLEIFREVVDLYDKNILYFSDQQYENDQQTTKEKKKDDIMEGYEYTPELSSHILGFMRWVPILSDDETDCSLELLISIENVIDKIQNQIVNEYGSIVTHQRLKKCKDGSLFIDSNQVDNENLLKSLRQLLIKALFSEEYIRLQFKSFYQIPL